MPQMCFSFQQPFSASNHFSKIQPRILSYLQCLQKREYEITPPQQFLQRNGSTSGSRVTGSAGIKKLHAVSEAFCHHSETPQKLFSLLAPNDIQSLQLISFLLFEVHINNYIVFSSFCQYFFYINSVKQK